MKAVNYILIVLHLLFLLKALELLLGAVQLLGHKDLQELELGLIRLLTMELIFM